MRGSNEGIIWGDSMSVGVGVGGGGGEEEVIERGGGEAV